jgi:ribonuclease T1
MVRHHPRGRGCARLRGRGTIARVSRRLLTVLLAVVGLALVAGCGTTVTPAAGPAEGAAQQDAALPPSDVDPISGLPWVLAVELPPSAQDTLLLIDSGGPFPYSKDGSTFGNREGLLPDEPTGYYAEYTVPKPGEDDRGPWRLVTGDGGEVYWTQDHYSSFERVWG